MHGGLWEKLSALDPVDTARRAKCEYIPFTGHYEVVLLGRRFIVDPADKKSLQQQKTCYKARLPIKSSF